MRRWGITFLGTLIYEWWFTKGNKRKVYLWSYPLAEMEVNTKILAKHIIEIPLLPHVEVLDLIMTHM